MKPIKITGEIVERMVAEFRKALTSTTITDGQFVYKRSLICEADDEPQKMHVIFTQPAFIKMRSLIDAYEGEVAWHGVVKRTAKDTFLVTDILVYPQYVSNAYVDFDQERYAKWLFDNRDDPRFADIHMQCHSHVNFEATPSEKDLQSNRYYVNSMGDHDFYIIMIWNKKMSYNVKLYDNETNTLYEGTEVSISVEGFDKEAFVAEAKKIAAPMSEKPVPKKQENDWKGKTASGTSGAYFPPSEYAYDGYYMDRKTNTWKPVQTSFNDKLGRRY